MNKMAHTPQASVDPADRRVILSAQVSDPATIEESVQNLDELSDEDIDEAELSNLSCC